MSPIPDGRRLVVAHNPNSARAAATEKHVFWRLNEAGYDYVVLEVRQASLEDNVARLAPQIQPGDIVLSCGGDGSAHAVFHTVMAANQPGVELGFMAFGNFNDAPYVFDSKKTLRDPVAFLEEANPVEVWPLELLVDGKSLRSALLYASVGWTAGAAGEFDNPKVRHKITHGGAGIIKSLWRAGLYYLKTRRHSGLPLLRYQGASYKKSDLLFANGPAVARVFKTGKSYYAQPVFLFRMLNVRWLVPNIPFIAAGLFGRIKGKEVSSALVEFERPFSGQLQCDGEVVGLEGVSSIEVRKSNQSLAVLTTKRSA